MPLFEGARMHLATTGTQTHGETRLKYRNSRDNFRSHISLNSRTSCCLCNPDVHCYIHHAFASIHRLQPYIIHTVTRTGHFH